MTLRELFAPLALAGWRLIRRLAPPSGGAFRILLFHDIPDTQSNAFSALVERIASTEGFITPAEAVRRLQGSVSARDKRVPYLLSFDDGFASNRLIAETVLARHGVKALFFVCPALVDLPAAERPSAVAQGIFGGRKQSDHPDVTRPLMDWADIRALHLAGHEIGAHSLTHRRLAGLEEAALRMEVNGSCDRFGEVLGRAPDWFAWPFGDIESVDGPALEAIAQRVRFCRSGVRGLNRPGQHRLMVFADHIDLSASAAWQNLVMAGGLDWRYGAARTELARLAYTAGSRQAVS
jgi:peptidoglycan/xylan/chitin deacetylase (PgdA/CDA1 family)